MKQMTFLALLALASCAAVPAVPAVPAPDRANGATAPLGEIANIHGAGVRPLAVLEDSRCPASVQCVWAGRVRIRAEVIGDGIRELTLGEPALVKGGTLTLIDVQPARQAPGVPPPAAYRFTFAFKR